MGSKGTSQDQMQDSWRADPGSAPPKEQQPVQVTPKSSWESLENEDAHLKGRELHDHTQITRPAQSNNPFRQADLSSKAGLQDSLYMEERESNPWSNQSGKSPIYAPSAQLGTFDFEKNTGTLGQQDIPAGELAQSGDTASPPKDSYRHGLEELALPPQSSGGQKSRESFSDRKSPPPSNYLNTGFSAPSTAMTNVEAAGTLSVQQAPNQYGYSRASGPADRMGSSGSSKEKNTSSPSPPPIPEKVNEAAEKDLPKVPSSSMQPIEQSKSKRASETYQIRLVNWTDTSSLQNPRRSPTMVQNANGPCPLLALVNALVLSTPSGVTTALIETLRVREQVSLGLLLDAVIDELMSGRRGDAAQNLPDVSDLYAFLVTLHTGMNVNPCFVPSAEPVNLMDALIDVPSAAADFRKPGGFEETREMKLYGTFAIPLIHGWIPPRTHPAFAALQRRAGSYEDAQNLLFREEELEDKLQGQGLSQDEQVILEDIGSIKYFLSSTATQLTGYGLDTITETLAPGSLAILFRNDHFSTLYRHPRSGQLLTLVTDMGYAGHDEVVWESLVDVSGEGSEFYSGDFRPVGNFGGESSRTGSQNANDDGGGWTTVENRSRRSQQNVQSKRPDPLDEVPPLENLDIQDRKNTASPNTEQEDHDLALAMQLQEEEEERHRQQNAKRRREDQLSQEYLNNADSQGRRTFPGFGRGARGAPAVPPRGGSNTTSNPNSRPPVRRQASTDDAPPPSYEQAAQGPAYHPPADHPFYSPSSSGEASRSPQSQPRRPRGSSAYSEHAATFGGSPSTHGLPRQGGSSRGRGMPAAGTRRRNGTPIAAGVEEERKEKDCILM